MKRERTRLQMARDKATQKKAEVTRELKALKRELTAIEAYDKARGGSASLLRSASAAAGAGSAKRYSRSSASIPTACPVARS
jgi:hypothetical protein